MTEKNQRKKKRKMRYRGRKKTNGWVQNKGQTTWLGEEWNRQYMIGPWSDGKSAIWIIKGCEILQSYQAIAVSRIFGNECCLLTIC